MVDASDITELSSSLDALMRMLKFHYHKNAIVLIDEYDAPLNEAYYHGYSEKRKLHENFPQSIKTGRGL